MSLLKLKILIHNMDCGDKVESNTYHSYAVTKEYYQLIEDEMIENIDTGMGSFYNTTKKGRDFVDNIVLNSISDDVKNLENIQDGTDRVLATYTSKPDLALKNNPYLSGSGIDPHYYNQDQMGRGSWANTGITVPGNLGDNICSSAIELYGDRSKAKPKGSVEFDLPFEENGSSRVLRVKITVK